MAFFTRSGVGAFLKSLTGDTSELFTAETTHIGVGDSLDVFSPDQTDLLGDERLRIGMDTGYPVVSGNTITFRATAEEGQGNFDWNEIGIFNAAEEGVMLCRDVNPQGAKTSAQAWQVTIELVVS